MQVTWETLSDRSRFLKVKSYGSERIEMVLDRKGTPEKGI